MILANLAHSDRLNHVVTLAGRGVREPADLGGRRVALPAGTNAAFLWYLFRAYHGLEAEAVTLIDAAPSRLGDLLLAGEADAAVLWEPWTSRLRARAGEALRVLPGSELYTAKWMLVTRRDLAQQRPKLCRAVLSAYRDAVRWIGRHRSAALELYLARSTRRQDGLAEAWKGMLFDLSLDWTLLAGLQQQVEWAKAAGLMPAGLAPDLLAHIDAGPLRALAPERVHMPAGALDQSETDP